jgi:cation diffusion facilitator CzcD-associated flavoprotein CzcO
VTARPGVAREVDVAVIGGGQSALAVGYYLRRTPLSYVLLDEQPGPGGAWRHTWPSLRLFSPAQWSSLPGWPGTRTGGWARGPDDYPTRDEALAYIAEYERRYAFPVERPVRVSAVHRETRGLLLDTTAGAVRARAVVSATGTWRAPRIPELPGREQFRGDVLHSSAYSGPAPFVSRRVVVVGAGNSGAQIVADLSPVARVTWATREPPRFLPDDVDGRFLFAEESARWRAMQDGRTSVPAPTLGDIVMVEAVRAARDRGALDAVPLFERFTEGGVVWPGGREEAVDAVVLATGFRPALAHLAPLGVADPVGRVAVRRGPSGATRAAAEPRLWLVGYGDWTGFASATLIGVGRWARATVHEIVAALRLD